MKGSSYSNDHTARDHIHMDIAYNTEEPQQKYPLGMVSIRLLGGLKMFYWVQTSPYFSEHSDGKSYCVHTLVPY